MLTILILTYNEEQHLARCLESLKSVATRICIIDSESTDRTHEIAQKHGAEVFVNPWPGDHATQVNWALKNCDLQTDWVMRMDADEYILPELSAEINEKLKDFPSAITGVNVSRRVIFKGKWLKHGGFYPIDLLRIWRNGIGHCEQRLMDEHIVLSHGEVAKFSNDIVDENLNYMHWWTTKHNNYARREAADLLSQKYNIGEQEDINEGVTIKQAVFKRFLKEKIYQKLPLGIRPAMYFTFRFFFQLGILDGPRGWIFHYLQGFWYRFLVDVNIWECERACDSPEGVEKFISEKWGISLFKKG